MSLQVWLPLNGSLKNKGLANVTVTNSGATVDDAGKIGKCYSFDGSDDRISIDGLLLENTWSYGCWFNSAPSIRGWEAVILLNTNSGDADTQLGFYIYPNASRMQSTANGQYNANITFTSDGIWHHFFATFDGTNLKTYIDGILKDTKIITANLLQRTKLTLGARVNGTGFSTFFTGKINDVRIYDHCLSDKEVKEISKGLALHYKLDDGYVESTTNLLGGPTYSFDTCYNGVTGKYGFGTNTDIYQIIGEFNGKRCTKVYMGTAGVSAHPYPHFDQIKSTPAINNYKTISFDYYPTTLNSLVFYSHGTSCTFSWILNNKTTGTSGTITGIILNQWNHIEITIYNNDTTTGGCGYVKIGTSSHTSTITDYWLFANMQIEEKDHATPYTPTSRIGNIVYDCSGNGYDGTVNGSLSTSSDSARYLGSTVFDGNAASITLGNLATICPERNFTFNCWIYKDGTWSTKKWETIFGGPSGFELETKYSGTNSPVIVNYNWGKTSMPYNLNEWTMITMTRNSSETKYYINGSLAGTGTAGTIPSGNYFIGAWSSSAGQNYKGKVSDVRIYNTILSESDIKELYETSVSIDKNGNLYCRELVEV